MLSQWADETSRDSTTLAEILQQQPDATATSEQPRN